jgi:hypothetical protein
MNDLNHSAPSKKENLISTLPEKHTAQQYESEGEDDNDDY